MMSTLRDDSAAAKPERSAVGSAFPVEHPLSPRKAVAKTRRAAALAQHRRPTSENRAEQHETQTKNPVL